MADNKNVYIRSMEASDIYEHMHRNGYPSYEYIGMTPYSLELIKLKKSGFNTFVDRISDKDKSKDIINVRFNRKVKSKENIIKTISNKIDIENENMLSKYVGDIEKIESTIDYIGKCENFINSISDNEDWLEVKQNDLREELYREGFTITEYNKRTQKTKSTKYVVYKRSGAKSRTGQVLFIREALYKKMINWSRMGIPFKKDMMIDYPGLLAYESLVGSAIESTIEIDPMKILIITDIDSKFKQECSVIKTGDDGFLDSFIEDAIVSNSLFDGQSILDSKYFDGHAMKLLRMHMFKSAAFSGNLQLFFRDHCPSDINYDDWQIPDMFGNLFFAKDIEMITTPNSMKAFKFSSVIGSDSDMYDFWRLKVLEDDCVFGVCKHEKKSKHGDLQQTSYQMLNSMPISDIEIGKLMGYEIANVKSLKNNDEYYMEYLLNEANDLNSNQMFYDINKINKGIQHTKIFRELRKQKINGVVEHIKRGKLRLKGDYCVLFGNPHEMLLHAIGEFELDGYVGEMNDNEIYTTMFPHDKEYVAFRNPHTAPSNVLISKNVYSPSIRKYFNLTKNIVCVNAINFAIQDILSSCDYDSDTAVIFDNYILLWAAKKCFNNYRVCLNSVESQKKQYRLNLKDMSDIDNQLANSQRIIGTVVNLGQDCMSKYWNREFNSLNSSELLKKVDVMTVLSCISIDLAKKFYEIDIKKEIRNVKSIDELQGDKPLFWSKVSQSKKITTTKHETPMDYLFERSGKIPRAPEKSNAQFSELLKSSDTAKVNRRQYSKIADSVNNYSASLRNIYNMDIEKEEKYEMVDDENKKFRNYIKNLKINQNTMIKLLSSIDNSEKDIEPKNKIPLLKALYDEHKDIFLASFRGYDPKKLQV